jgi:hypothetical protein
MEAFKPPIINQLALTDDVEGLWSVENRYQSSAKAFLHDQDPFRTLGPLAQGSPPCIILVVTTGHMGAFR